MRRMVRQERRHMTPREIAALNAEEYEEPGRDLEATRPVEPRGAGAVGDEPNPQGEPQRRSDSARWTQDAFGSDEKSRLARSRRR